jgi:hypothetical protein
MPGQPIGGGIVAVLAVANHLVEPPPDAPGVISYETDQQPRAGTAGAPT